MRPERLAVVLLAGGQHVVEPLLELLERPHQVPHVRALFGPEITADYTFTDELDQRVRLGIHVFARQQHFREFEDLLEPPDQRLHVPDQRFVRTERVEIEAVRLVGREILHVREGLRRHGQALVDALVLLVQLGRLIEKQQVRTFHVEAQRCN
jgi:hypothetical protein